MQAQHERMRAARKAKAEKMQKILTPEQFEQWKQMQGPKPGMGHGPQMKDGKGCACKEGRKCDQAPSRKGRQVRLGHRTACRSRGVGWSTGTLFLSIRPRQRAKLQ